MNPAEAVAARLAQIPGVAAVVEAGSGAAGAGDSASDVDLYVYAPREPALPLRADIANAFAAAGQRVEIGNRFWEPGDEWVDRASGIHIDVMYRTPAWLEEQLARVLLRCQASIGYSTCLWWNVLHSRALYHRDDWYARLQASAARTPYPPKLKQAIVARNRPLLRDGLSFYRHQIALALDRRDTIGVAHRTSAFLASYFDILFAVNESPHPGEKRLLEYAARLCPRRPARLQQLVAGLLGPAPLASLDAPCDALDGLCPRED